MEKITKYLKADFSAGLVVFLVAVPLCLGVALASTGSSEFLFAGIITGVIGGVVVGLLSGSALGVSGPAAGLVVIVLGAISTLGSYQAFLMALVLAGLIQVLLGVFKAGVIAYYFPSSVIKGMLAAIGLMLILKELPHLVGYDIGFMGDESFSNEQNSVSEGNTISDLWNSIYFCSIGAIIISVISIGMIFVLETKRLKNIKIFKILPSALWVVLIGIAINQLFKSFVPNLHLDSTHLVGLPVATSFADFKTFFVFPDFTALGDSNIYGIAITLAIVASIETLLSVEATDKLDQKKRVTPTSRELMAQGTGNIVSGLIGGLPITQVIVRSSANIEAGGKSKLATVIHGVILLLSAIFIAQFLNLIPLASLASILLVVGYKLSKIGLYKSMYKLGLDQFIPFAVTVVTILFTDLLKGVGLGVAFALYFILKNNYNNPYRLRPNYDTAQPGSVTLKLSEVVTFLNKGAIQYTLKHLRENTTITIDGLSTKYIDYDVLEMISDFKKHKASEMNITVVLLGVKEVETTSSH